MLKERLFGLTLAASLNLGCNNSPSAETLVATGGEPAQIATSGNVGFGPLDTSCATTADCDVIWGYYIRKDGKKCCRGCALRVGRTAELQREANECQTYSNEGCPLKKCGALPEVACVSGRCEAQN